MNEEKLSQELKQGIIRRVYYFYGNEPFLTETYAKRVRDACLNGYEDDGFNLVKFRGTPDISAIADAVQTLPMFTDRRVVILNDLDAEKLDEDSLADLISILASACAGASSSVCVIIYITGLSVDSGKAKTKKLLEAIGKSGKNATVINFDKMNEGKTADLVIKRAARNGCTISRSNAALLARLCLRNLTLIAAEVDKLCAYAGYTGEITGKSIELLTARQLDSGVFALASEITAKRGRNALMLLDELIEQGNHPTAIMAALSTAYIDFYRAKLGTAAGKRSETVAGDFGYPVKRAWAVGKAMTAVSRMTSSHIRQSLQVLCDADYRLKSSPATFSASERSIMERAVVKLLTMT